MLTRSFAVITLAALAPIARAQTYQLTANIPYGDGNARQVLDIYRPTAPSPALRPVVLWIHGGGWQNGDKALPATRTAALQS